MCNKCNLTKPLSEFYKNKTCADCLMGYCKDCKRKQNKNWSNNNSERHKELKDNWYKANKEDKLVKSAAWRKEHPDKMNEYSNAYKKRKPEKNRLWSSIRRARVRNAMPKWIKVSDLLPIYEEAQRISKETGIPHDVDHIIPLCAVDDSGKRIACGLHVPWNLQVITAKKNRQKMNKIK